MGLRPGPHSASALTSCKSATDIGSTLCRLVLHLSFLKKYFKSYFQLTKGRESRLVLLTFKLLKQLESMANRLVFLGTISFRFRWLAWLCVDLCLRVGLSQGKWP